MRGLPAQGGRKEGKALAPSSVDDRVVCVCLWGGARTGGTQTKIGSLRDVACTSVGKTDASVKG